MIITPDKVVNDVTLEINSKLMATHCDSSTIITQLSLTLFTKLSTIVTNSCLDSLAA